METKLARISQLSKENPDMVFTSLGHLLNKEMLKSCHAQMDGTKAVGIDGITKEEYGRSLEENINALIERLKKKSYKEKVVLELKMNCDARDSFTELLNTQYYTFRYMRALFILYLNRSHKKQSLCGNNTSNWRYKQCTILIKNVKK